MKRDIFMITGSLVALVTPMQADGSIDWVNLEQLIEFHIENGTSAIVAVGTTGESATLTMEEHESVIKFTVKQCNARIPVIAGTGGNSTSEAIHLTTAAKEAGADAALVVVPYYNKPPQEGLYQHFKAIAEAVDIPQILYNVPSRTVCDLADDTAIRLAALDNIVGIKDATGDLARAKNLIENVPEGFAVYSGDDGTAMELMLMGGVGNVSVTANISPKACAMMCEAAINGDREQAERMNNTLTPLNNVLFLEANPIPIKWALSHIGLIPTGIRLPLVELNGSYHQDVEQALQQAGIV